MKSKFPLMKNNITRNDLDKVIKHLKKKDPILTQHKNVEKFENNWSKWLGVKYSVFVNSGSSANLLSIALLKIKYPKGGEIIVPPITWSSDISSVLHFNFTPVFVDINLNNLSMNDDLIISKINKKTKAIFLSHIQGFNGLTKKLLDTIKKKKILLIEDVCESHGASFKNKKLGSYGWTSNFSFYYAHHMTTIEGGMISTNDKWAYNSLLMLRSHGMAREVKDFKTRNSFIKKNKHLNPEFIFMYPAFNLRNNEIGGILGNSQLKNLDRNVIKRNNNFNFFLKKLNKHIFYTNFDLDGSSNYAFNLILIKKNPSMMLKICNSLKKHGIEFRKGSAGGGNQVIQPYIPSSIRKRYFKKLPNANHIHNYGMYIGNYPDLKKNQIQRIVDIINKSVL